MGKKRKGYFSHKHGGKKTRGSKLDVGMSGIMITCNNREREAVTESYKLLEEYADMLYGPDTNTEENIEDENDQEDDIEAALKKEIASLKETKKWKRFQQVDTGTNNVIFVRTTLENPTSLVDKIFEDCYNSKERKSRHIMRFLPILKTCGAYDERITKTACEVLGQYLEKEPTTHCFQIKVRNNGGVSRTHLVNVLGQVMEEHFPYSVVDLSNPDYTITVDVLKTIACIGCVSNFSKYRKYNLQEVVSTSNETDKKEDKNENDSTKTEEKKCKERDASDNENSVNDKEMQSTEVDKDTFSNGNEKEKDNTSTNDDANIGEKSCNVKDLNGENKLQVEQTKDENAT